jgi:hypothetical protein
MIVIINYCCFWRLPVGIIGRNSSNIISDAVISVIIVIIIVYTIIIIIIIVINIVFIIIIIIIYERCFIFRFVPLALGVA